MVVNQKEKCGHTDGHTQTKDSVKRPRGQMATQTKRKGFGPLGALGLQKEHAADTLIQTSQLMENP